MAFPNLENDFKTSAELDKLEPLSGYDSALHQSQADDLSSEGSQKTKKFFDYMALHVLIPCINALNRAVKALKGDTSTSLETLEKKLTELSGDTTTSVAALDERVDSVEKVSAVSTAKVDAATELAKAAVENVMKKDQCASVMDLITGLPLYFGSGTDEEIAEMKELLPGEAILFNKSADQFLDDLKKGKMEAHEIYSDEELDNKLIDIINSMGGQCFKRFVISLKNTENFTKAGGHYYVDLYKLSTNYAMIIMRSYIKGGRTIQRIWFSDVEGTPATLRPWEWQNPPMLPMTEYRTVERWKGYPVYKKAIEFTYEDPIGDGENSVEALIPTEIVGKIELFRCMATGSYGGILPYVAQNGGVTAINGLDADNKLIFRTVKDQWSAQAFSIEISYTKESEK